MGRILDVTVYFCLIPCQLQRYHFSTTSSKHFMYEKKRDFKPAEAGSQTKRLLICWTACVYIHRVGHKSPPQLTLPQNTTIHMSVRCRNPCPDPAIYVSIYICVCTQQTMGLDIPTSPIQSSQPHGATIHCVVRRGLEPRNTDEKYNGAWRLKWDGMGWGLDARIGIERRGKGGGGAGKEMRSRRRLM